MEPFARHERSDAGAREAPKIAIITGEASGDLLGSLLARRIGEMAPDAEMWGAGGKRMREAGVDLVCPSAISGAIGISEAFKQVPGLLLEYFRVRRALLARRPDVLTLIDFGTFNKRVAGFARRHGILTVYYMPPGAWRRKARKGRVHLADKFITPFEWSCESLKSEGADVTLVGHPLLDVVHPALSESEFLDRLGLRPGRPVVALLPGSRKQEIKHIWPVVLRAVKLIEAEIPGLRYVVAAAGQRQAVLIESALSGANVPDIRVAHGITYDALAYANLAITASGTATLEAAILNTPMVIVYRGSCLSHLEYLLRGRTVLEEHIGLPNIIAGKRICPELLSKEATPEKIARLAIGLLKDPSSMAAMKQELLKVRSSLGQNGGDGIAARVILEAAGRELTA
ncbi:MAG: lipid-A-disaccharide synthase [Armatimonadota bacterium]|nr:lipid-A-disaccharide synthase [Armatimonadota bacterium]